MSTKQPASAHNAPTLDDEVTLALRAITEKRAATLGYLLDESRQRHQPDDYARDAIRHYGRDIGRSVRAKMRHGHDLQEFAAVFTRGLESRVYEMETVSASPSEFIVLFHYCPYVNCWRQQGRDARQIETLCDICMEGNHALTDALDGVQLAVETALFTIMLSWLRRRPIFCSPVMRRNSCPKTWCCTG